MDYKRKDQEPPYAIFKLGWRYHHLGIPTKIKREGETYIPHLKMFVSGFETSPFGVEWMRFEDGCKISELIQNVPHIAFEVDNLDSAIIGQHLIGDITSPAQGTRVAMIKHNGMPVELIEFKKGLQ